MTVTLTDVEERSTVALKPSRGWVNAEADPPIRTRFTASLDDGDGIVGAVSRQWALSSSESINGATSSSYIATADDVNRYLRVTATYRDSRSMEEGGDKTMPAVLRTRIGDTRPEANASPEFAESTDTRTIASGPAAGRAIGSRVSATDADGDVLTYKPQGQGRR